MAYKKYVYKKGKRHGPYYYHSYREGNSVKKVYIGGKREYKDWLKKNSKSEKENKKERRTTSQFIFSRTKSKWILLVPLFILLLFGAFFLYQPKITGKAGLDIKDSYVEGEIIKGNLALNLKKGELIPIDSKLVVKQNGLEVSVIPLSQIIHANSNGSFYVENIELSGYGQGYGTLGEMEAYPLVFFTLQIYDSETVEHVEEVGGGAGQEEDINRINETSIGGEEGATEDTESEEITETGTSEIMEEPSGIEEIPESEEPEDINEVKEQPAGETEEGVQEPIDVTEEEQETVPETIIDTPKGEAEVSGPESSPITGEAISDSEIIEIKGSCSKDYPFIYELSAGETAGAKKGSVEAKISKENGETEIQKLPERSVALQQEGNQIEVSTEYSIIQEGFGEKFLSDEEEFIEISLEDLGIKAEEGIFSISLIYEEIIIAETEKRVTVQPEKPEENITEIKNITFVNETQANLTEINVTETNFTVSNATELNITTKQYKAVIGKPVKWLKKVKFDRGKNESLILELPKKAENITIKTGQEVLEAEQEIEEYEEIITGPKSEQLFKGLTGQVSLDLEIDREKGIFTRVWDWITNIRITGRIIEEQEIRDRIIEKDDKKIINLTDIAREPVDETLEEIAVEYYTEAPQAAETKIFGGKRLIVSAPDELNYTEVLAYTLIENKILMNETEKIEVYWIRREEVAEKIEVEERATEQKQNLTLTELEYSAEDMNNTVTEKREFPDATDEIMAIIAEHERKSRETENQTQENETQESEAKTFNPITGQITLEEIQGPEQQEPGKTTEQVRERINVTSYDLDEDGRVDYIEWTVPHLSGQAYEIFAENLEDYVELLVKTSDNIHTNKPRWQWTEEDYKEERSGNAKQGYITMVRPAGWTWGNLEKDPKRYGIIRIPKEDFNESWLEPEYDYDNPSYLFNLTECKEVFVNMDFACKDLHGKKYNDCVIDWENQCEQEYYKDVEYPILTQRKYRIPLESFLTTEELNNLRNIEYNSEVNWSIEKEIIPEEENIIKGVTGNIVSAITGRAIFESTESITNKIIANDWDNRPEDMKLHGSGGTFTICPSGCNYSSLLSWEEGEEGTITSDAPCIANITEGFSDSAGFAISGWTTDADSYIMITTAPAARHKGKWDEQYYNLDVVSSSIWALTVFEEFFRIDGVQIRETRTSGAGTVLGINAAGTNGDVRISNNILYNNGSLAQENLYFNVFGAGGIAYVWNNIIYNTHVDNSYDSQIYGGGSGAAYYIYSNTIIDAGGDAAAFGIRAATPSLIAKNNVVNNSGGDCYYSTFNTTSDYNVCSNADTTGQGSHNQINTIYTYDDPGNVNFHISSSNGHGTDLSSGSPLTFLDDIDGDERSAWDAGADEYVNPDTEYPQFSSYWDNNGSLSGSGTALFNVTILSTNGTVFLEINNTNYTASNVSGSGTRFNVSVEFSSGSNGTYDYRWHSWGNGSQSLYNKSVERSYTINKETTPPVVYLKSPENASLQSSPTVYFAANFTDNVALRNSTVYVWNSSDDLINNTETDSIYSMANTSNISVILPYEGNFTWNYYVCDNSDNCAWNSTNWTFTYIKSKIGLDLITPSNTDFGQSVGQALFFNVIVNVSCHDINCSEINVSLNSNESLVNITTGATPFYTNVSNPYNISLNAGESEIVTFLVNATGDKGMNYTFFIFANKTSDMHISNITSNWSVNISNVNPVTSTPQLSPQIPVSSDDLNCSFTITDSDAGDTLTVNVTWYKDSVSDYSISGMSVNNNVLTSTILDSGNTSIGDYWKCEIQPYDGISFGTSKNSSEVEILESTYPQINFTNPTPDDESSQEHTSIYVNLSAEDANNNLSVFIDFDNSLVGWWRMDDVNSSGDVVDYLGRNNGTSVGDAAQNDSGYLGKSFSFDKNGDYINLGNDSRFDVRNMNFTFSAWARLDSMAGGDMEILVKGYSGAAIDLRWDDGNDAFAWTISDGEWKQIYHQSTTTTGVWYHVVGVRRGTVSAIYVNGIPGDTNETIGTISSETSDNNLTIGRIGDSSDRYWNGSIDDVMIFNRSLTLAEIQTLYSNTSTKHLGVNFTELNYSAHTFKAYAQDTEGNVNETETRTVTTEILAPSVESLTETPTDSPYYSFGQQYEFNATVTDSSLDAVFLEFNGTNYTASNVAGDIYNVTFPDLQAGSYTYRWYANDTQGGVNNTETGSYTINKASVSFSTSITNSITYGAASDYTGSESNNGDDDCIYSLARNETEIDTGSSVSDTKILMAGTYNYNYSTSGCMNYSPSSSNDSLIVSKAVPEGSLTNTTNWTVGAGTEVTIGLSESNTGDNDLTYKVYRDNVDKDTGETWTPGPGVYNYILNTTGGQNYTANASMDTGTLTVEDESFPDVIINTPTSTTYSTSSIDFNVTATDGSGMDSCWYTLNSGVKNYTLTNTTANDDYNHTNSSIADGSYTANFYCNDTSNNVNDSESVSFSIDTAPKIGLEMIYPTGDINATQNYFFNVTLNVSCSNVNCGEINVSLDPEPAAEISGGDYGEEIITTNSGIKIGEVVKWKKKVNVKDTEIEIEIPGQAENVKVERIGENEKRISITRNVVIEEGEKSVFAFFRRMLSTITGKAIAEEKQTIKIDDAGEYEIAYGTPAPKVKEMRINGGKRVVVSAPDELGYENVVAYTEIENSKNIKNKKQIRLDWVREGREEVGFNALDRDRDGNIDYIEWTVPHLSEQIYEIIYISKAEHLDSEREFIADIYEEVKEKDGRWSEKIRDGEYVRVRFERNLSKNDNLMIYTRSADNELSQIEVYAKNREEVIVKFEDIGGANWHKAYLKNLPESENYNVFDLEVSGEVEFDYVFGSAWTKVCDEKGICIYQNEKQGVLAEIWNKEITSENAEPHLKLSKWGGEASFEIKVPEAKKSEQSITGFTVSEESSGWGNLEAKEENDSIEIYSESRDVRWYYLEGFENKYPLLEMEETIKQKPDSNVFEYEIKTENLEFYYQPALNETPKSEFLDGEKIEKCAETECFDKNGNTIVYRPENVVGSYAVYHSSKRDNEYMTGKAFHIYRPKIIDSNGEEIWGEMNIHDGKLSISIDKEWLENAEYPIIIDPTLGYTTIGGSSTASSRAWAYPYTTSEVGEVIAMNGYVNSAAVPHHFAIYSDTGSDEPYHVLAQTASTSTGPAGAGWITATSISYSLQNGVKYWLAHVMTSSSRSVYYDSSGGQNLRAGPDNVFGWEDPWTTGVSVAWKPSIYLNYTVDSEYPQFSSYWDNNNSLSGSGTALFNVTLLSTNGTVFLEINNTNYTASNVSGSATRFNVSIEFAAASNGTYAYRWHSWGNGSQSLYNKSVERSYTIGTATPASSKGGLVNTTVGATPFYTNVSNPYNISLNAGESEIVTFWVNATGDLDSSYEFFIYVNQTANMSISNISNTWNVTISPFIDTIKPSITINTPTSTTYSTSSIDFNVTATDGSGMDSCWYTLNSGVKNYTLTNTTANDDYNHTNSSIADGSYTANFYCNDTSNNVNDSESVGFSVDATYPTLSITYPANKTYATSSLALNYTYTETNCDSAWYNNGTDDSSRQNCGLNWSSITVGDGSHTWILYINDTANNLNNTNVTFNVDATNPTITIVKPNNNSNYDSSNIGFNITLSESVKFCDLSINGDANVSMTNISSTSFNYTNGSIGNGMHSFVVSCNDTLDNVGTSETYYFYIDSIYPLVNFTNPTPDDSSTQANTDIYVNVTSSDTASNISTFIDFDNSLVGWWRMDDVNSSGDPQDNSGHCYDNETRVMTSEGWRYFKDVSYEDEILTLNSENGNREYHNPFEMQDFDSPEFMYRIKTEKGDLVISPKHKIYSNIRLNNSNVLKTLTNCCFFNNFSSDQIGQLNLSANAKYGISLICPFNISCALGMNDENSSLGINLILSSIIESTSLNSSSPLCVFNNISSLLLENSSSKNSGAISCNCLDTNISFDFLFPLISKENISLASETANIYFSPLSLNLFANDSLTFFPSLKASSFVNSLSLVKDSKISNCWTFFVNASLATSDQFIILNDSILCLSSSGTATVIFDILNTSSRQNALTQNNVYTPVYKFFGLEDVKDVYEGFNLGEEIYFLDENNNLVKVENIIKEGYKGRMYDVDVPNDIILVERKGLRVWSGNSNNGSAKGDAHQVDNGKMGKGFEFDGEGDYVDVGNDSSVQFTGPFTVSVWIMGTVTNNVIVSRNEFFGAASNAEFYFAVHSSATLRLLISNGTTQEAADIVKNAAFWATLHHVVGVWNGTNITLYIDGSLAKTSATTISAIQTTGKIITIGSDSGNPSYFWNGTIDDVMIFNRSLSAAEIQALYANTSTKHLGVNFTGLSTGDHTFKAYTQDYGGNVNSTETRTVTTGNTAPDTPTVSINSTDLSNKTLQDLHCYATIIDPDSGDEMDVTVQWYKDGVLDLTIDYNNSCPNNTLFNATLYNGNTSKGEDWSCAMRLYDGIEYSNWAFSENLTILNTAPNVALVSPSQGNITTDRSPAFNWTGNDPDSDSLQYEINITCRESGSIVTVGSVYKDIGEIGGNVSYASATGEYLKCLSDNGQIYNWTVRAYDGEDYGTWNSSERNLSIQSLVTISLAVDSINFGDLNISVYQNTSDDDPSPFVLSNDGNAEVNISVNFTNLWDTEPNPSQFFQYKVRDSSGCFMTVGSQTTWAQAPSITSFAINRLNFTSGYQTGCSNVSIDIHVQVPEDETPGNKSSITTFISSLAEEKVS